MEKYKIEDIPKEVVDEMMKKVHEHEEYLKLVKKKSNLLMCGNYIEAMKIAKLIAKVENDCLMNYIHLYEGEVKKVTELTDSMNEEDKDTMAALGNSLVMLSDVLETLIMETNGLLKKYHPNYRVEMFDKLNELAKESRYHVRMLDDYKSDTFYTNLFGDTVDNLTEMIINKARSFTKKTKTYYAKEANKNTKRNAKMA